MHLADFELPSVIGNQVLVKVAAASINPFDWKLREGELKLFTGSKFPRAMGSDFSGIVEVVGPKVSRFKAGDAVVGTVSPKSSGAFGPKLVAEERLLVQKPASLTFAEAATLPIPGVTAWLALVKKAKLKRGQTLFLNGAMGGVGQMAIALAKDIGDSIVGRISAASVAEATAMGVDPALDYNKPIPTELRGSMDVVFDCNGGLSPHESALLLKPGGMVIDINLSKTEAFRFLRSWSQKLVFFDGAAKNLQAVVDLAGAGRIKSRIARMVTLEEAIPLIRALESGKRLDGKSVILFDQP